MAEGNLFNEKRLHPRAQVGIDVKYKLIEDHGEIKSIMDRQKRNLEGKSVDMSLGGVYIIADGPLNLGSLMKIEMHIDKERGALIAFAEVVWSNETGGGIKFLSMKDGNIEVLKTFLAEVS